MGARQTRQARDPRTGRWMPSWVISRGGRPRTIRWLDPSIPDPDGPFEFRPIFEETQLDALVGWLLDGGARSLVQRTWARLRNCL